MCIDQTKSCGSCRSGTELYVWWYPRPACFYAKLYFTGALASSLLSFIVTHLFFLQGLFWRVLYGKPFLNFDVYVFILFAFPESSPPLLVQRSQEALQLWALPYVPSSRSARGARFLAAQWAQFQLTLKSVPSGQMAMLMCARKGFLNRVHCHSKL